MLTKKKWALFSLLTLCGGTIYKLPSLKDAFYIPMQEYFHLTNGQIGNAMSVNSFVTTVGFFLSIYFADKLPRRYTMSFSLIATGLLGVYGNDSNLLIVFYVQIMPDDFVMQLHRF